MKLLTEQQYRVASALTDPTMAHLRQQEIGARLGIASAGISSALKSVAGKVGIEGDGRTHILRTRLVIAAHKAGGFDQLAADLGLYNRAGESVQ